MDNPDRINRKLKIYKADDQKALGLHLHNEYEFIFIQDGSAHISIHGGAQSYGKNTFLAIDNLQNHTMTPEGATYVRYVMLINPSYFDQFVIEPSLRAIFSTKPDEFINAFPLSAEDAAYIQTQFDAAIAEYQAEEPFSEACVMAILLRVLVYLFRRHRERFPDVSRESAKILPVKSYIDQNFSDDLTLDNIAAHFFINKYHLAHLFKKVTGYSLKQYITLKRISFARELLCLSDKSITQIASECGFNSTSNFIRSFKSTEGATPLGFRKMFQTGATK